MTAASLSIGATGTADANGNVTITLDPVPLGQTGTGTLVVTNSPAGAVWTASVSGTGWGSWSGTNIFGPVQVGSLSNLVVTGVGLTAGVQVALQWQGVMSDSHSTELIWPAPNAQPQLLDQLVVPSPGQTSRSDVLGANGTVSFPLIPCSTWEGVDLNVFTQPNTGPVQVDLLWYADSAQRNFVTGREFVVGNSASTGYRAHMFSPNFGAFLKVTLLAGAGGATVQTIVALTSQPSIGWPLGNFNGLLVDVQNQSLGASTTFTATRTYAGPVYVQTWTNAASWVIELDGVDVAGTNHTVFRASSDENIGPNRRQVILVPAMPLLATLINNDGSNKNFTCTAVPAWTAS